MCFSDRLKVLASSILRALVMYRLKRNSFSSSTCWRVVYAVLALERTVAEFQDSLPRPLGLSSVEEIKEKESLSVVFHEFASTNTAFIKAHNFRGSCIKTMCVRKMQPHRDIFRKMGMTVQWKMTKIVHRNLPDKAYPFG